MQLVGTLLLAAIALAALFVVLYFLARWLTKWWKISKATSLKYAFVFALGFLVGPIVVVESFGSYTAHRIAEQDEWNKQQSLYAQAAYEEKHKTDSILVKPEKRSAVKEETQDKGE